MHEKLTKSQQEMFDLFQRHVNAELEGDLDTTMDTMSDDPHLHNIVVNMGVSDKVGVRKFYADHLVGKFFPPDVEMNVLSRTIGINLI